MRPTNIQCASCLLFSGFLHVVVPDACAAKTVEAYSCKPDSPPAKFLTADLAPPVKPDYTCLITMQTVQSMQDSSLLVDVRPRHEFQKYRINDSINFSASEVLTKDSLKTRPLILVGSGKNDFALLQDCAKLKRSGFRSVSVMKGGLVSWVDHKLPLSGFSPGVDQLRTLSPIESFSLSRTEGTLALLGPGAGTVGKLIPTLIDPEHASAALSVTKSGKGSSPHLISLIDFSTLPPTEERLVFLRQIYGDVPVLWAKPDPEALAQVARLQAATAGNKRKSSVAGCPS